MVYKSMNFGNHVQNEETGLISCPFFGGGAPQPRPADLATEAPDRNWELRTGDLVLWISLDGDLVVILVVILVKWWLFGGDFLVVDDVDASF